MIRDFLHLTPPRRPVAAPKVLAASRRLLLLLCVLAALGAGLRTGSLFALGGSTADPNEPAPDVAPGQAAPSESQTADPKGGVSPAETVTPDGGLGRPEAATKCPFCSSPQPAGAFFCTRCGRLFRLKTIDPLNRFWGDAFYMVTIPPATERVSITTDLAETGATHEVTTLYSGERYELDPLSKKGVIVTGDALAWGSTKAVPFRATVQTSLDLSQRISLREIFGVIKADPSRHLYRRIEYGYEGDLMSRIDVGTWIYPHDDDWKKHPSEWVRHEVLEIGIAYADGVPIRIDTTRREGRKGLRGNLEYQPMPAISDVVRVADGAVVSIRRAPSGP